MMKIIALTGGIGAGKSTVARALRDRGARIIDADIIARDCVDPASRRGQRVLQDIVRLLGPEVIADGELDRSRVADLIFQSDELMERYNAIVHPAILEGTIEELASARAARTRLVVHEIPLLTTKTARLPWRYDMVVTVEADVDTRLARLVQGRGYDRQHALARIRGQKPESYRTEIADVVLRTDGPLSATLHAVDTLWPTLTSG